MKNLTKNQKKVRACVVLTVVLIILLTVIFGFVTKYISSYTGMVVYNSECDSDVKVYINSENAEESLKDLELYSLLGEFNIFNCYDNIMYCSENGIYNFPSWEIEGKIIERDINESEFEELSQCVLRR